MNAMTKEKIKQPRGETVEFKGELIASTEFETKKQPPTTIALEIWRTEGGALIAVTDEGRADGQGFADVRVAVIEAKDYPSEQEMRFAVMRHFNWEARARDMVRKQLPEWDLVRRVP